MSYLTDEQLVAVNDEINLVVNADGVECAIHVLTLSALLDEVQAARKVVEALTLVRDNAVDWTSLPDVVEKVEEALFAYQQGKETR